MLNSLRRTSWRTIALVTILVVWIGCADHCAEAAYKNVIHERTQVFAHAAPPAKIWTETRGVLAESGVEFSEKAPPIETVATSPWRGKPGDRAHYTVRIVAGSPGEHFLEVNRVAEERVDIYPDAAFDDAGMPPKSIGKRLETTTKRDLDTEWAVLKRLAPKAALEIEAAAKKREEEVRDVVANGCK